MIVAADLHIRVVPLGGASQIKGSRFLFLSIWSEVEPAMWPSDLPSVPNVLTSSTAMVPVTTDTRRPWLSSLKSEGRSLELVGLKARPLPVCLRDANWRVFEFCRQKLPSVGVGLVVELDDVDVALVEVLELDVVGIVDELEELEEEVVPTLDELEDDVVIEVDDVELELDVVGIVDVLEELEEEELSTVDELEDDVELEIVKGVLELDVALEELELVGLEVDDSDVEGLEVDTSEVEELVGDVLVELELTVDGVVEELELDVVIVSDVLEIEETVAEVGDWDVELWDEDIDVVPVPQTSLPMFKE